MPEAQPVAPDEFAALCRRLRSDDRQAFEALFRRLRPELLRYAHSIVQDGSLAQDLVQDVFIDLWGRRATLDAGLPLRPYLFRMTRNRAYRHLRDERSHAEKHRQIRQEALGGAAHAESVSARIEAGDLGRRLQKWVDELPARQREALLLSRVHDLTHQEIADVMEISPRTVNNHMMRALTHLRSRIQAYEPRLLKP